jgi:hypothetical protein
MTKPKGDFQLAIGYWIVSHRDQLKKWWAISLLAFITVTAVGTIVFLIVFFGTLPRTDRLVSQAAASLTSFELPSGLSPRALEVTDAISLRRSATVIDVMATVKNPNINWAAQLLTVHFTVNGTAQPGQQLFLNQDTTRPVIQLNIPLAEVNQPTVSLTVDEIEWARANEAALPAAQFSFTDVKLVPTTVTIAGQARSTISVETKATNKSVYNYYRVIVPIVLKNGDTVVALDQKTIERWPTLQTKTIITTWPYAIAAANTVEITPQVSRFDLTNVYR